jgi:hypothetical protein
MLEVFERSRTARHDTRWKAGKINQSIDRKLCVDAFNPCNCPNTCALPGESGREDKGIPRRI